ncbi:MAG: hypothetical protein JSW72_07680, partial [Candidatus Bathyarchaeota archaeon]
MFRGEEAEEAIGKAKLLERKSDWLKAADLYEQALCRINKGDSLKRGSIQEQIGHCLHRASFQAENQAECRERKQQAVEAYEQACKFHAGLGDSQENGWMFRCKAMAKYLGYWLTSDSSERRRLLDECLEFERKALMTFWSSRNVHEYGKTYNELSNPIWFRVFLEWDRQAVERLVAEGVQWGEKAVAALAESGNSREIARAYLTSAIYLTIFEYLFVADPEKKEQYRLRIVKHLQDAVELLQRFGDAYSVGLSYFWLGYNTAGPESKKNFEKALEFGSKTQDNLLKAIAKDQLALAGYWKAIATENPNRRMKLAKLAMKLYDEAQHSASIISHVSLRSGLIASPGGYAEHYLTLAEWETNAKSKLMFLKKSEKAGEKALKISEDSDIPIIIQAMNHVLSKNQEAQALVETDSARKKTFLKRALSSRERSTEILDQWNPFNYWNRGVNYNYLAEIRGELSSLEMDVKNRRRLLEEAIADKEKCLKLCSKMAPYWESQGDIGIFYALYRYQDSFGTLLTRLYELTHIVKHLGRAIEVSRKAVESAKKANCTSRMAGSFWKIAKAQDVLREYLNAAEAFERASKAYAEAAEKIPPLKDFYQDHALYMQAWSEIEKAKHHHRKKQYELAKEHYEKAAVLHKKTVRWRYISSNYSALARVEEAENLSRREQTEKAKTLFQQAAKLFLAVEESIRNKKGRIEVEDEREMATELSEASNVRREYCLGRIELEEAKILDRQGNHGGSSLKYGVAAEKFQNIMVFMKQESERQELRPIVDLSRAWQLMTQAEAEASPELYLQASRLFDEAKEHSLDEKAKVLALGHSSFCRALEAGTRFEDSGDMKTYSTAKKHLEAAAKHYIKAGFKTAAEYSRATNRLFDAYIYMDRAETEANPKKKSELYQMAETLLQTSADSYTKAKHPEKSEQVQRLLETVREEKQLATSLTKILHAPTITSTTTSFSTPTAAHEQAVGLTRFEHADIQANLIVRAKEVRIGDDIDFRMELINAGKAPAVLVKIDDIMPKGFEIEEVPEVYTVEGSHLNLKGRRLDPLKTIDVKIIVKPRAKGTHTIKPRIL